MGNLDGKIAVITGRSANLTSHMRNRENGRRPGDIMMNAEQRRAFVREHRTLAAIHSVSQECGAEAQSRDTLTRRSS